MLFAAAFPRGLAYQDFLDKYATDEQRRRWDAVYDSVPLAEDQKALVQSFTREMHIVVLAGTWCGDCVNQCPIFERIAEQNVDRIVVRYFDRDDSPELGAAMTVCGGQRVPSVVFLSEDDQECGRYGDRTLSRYREMVASQLGAACPTGIMPPEDGLAAVTQEWLNEFERIQWMLRTSSRLRQLHQD